MKYLSMLTLIMFSFSNSAYAALEQFEVDHSKSQIEFKGVHAGKEFKGLFQKWDAKIAYDPENMGKSSIMVQINTDSAETGDRLYDGTLPQPEWFNIKDYPLAVYKSERIIKNPDGSFTSKGMLTIKDKTLPVDFTFKTDPQDISSSPVKTSFSFDIDRIEFNMGLASDDKAEWVSKNITVTVNLTANKK